MFPALFYFWAFAFLPLAAEARLIDLRPYQGILNIDQPTNPSYRDVTASIREGDELLMRGGQKFKVGKRLDGGRGAINYVFEILGEPDNVLRVPKDWDVMLSARRSYEEYEHLRRAGVTTIDMDPRSTGDFMIVERLPENHVRLNDFLTNIYTTRHDARMVEALKRFAKSFAAVESVHDAKAANIAYDPWRDTWVLFDWGHNTVPAEPDSPNGKSVFTWFYGELANHQAMKPQDALRALDDPKTYLATAKTTEKQKFLLELFMEAEESLLTERARIFGNNACLARYSKIKIAEQPPLKK